MSRGQREALKNELRALFRRADFYVINGNSETIPHKKKRKRPRLRLIKKEWYPLIPKICQMLKHAGILGFSDFT